jgi:hypothetical protein
MRIRSQRVASLTCSLGTAKGASPNHGRSLTLRQDTSHPLAWFVV